jgi:thiamine-phosphate pyrophosphorylase
VTRFPPGLLAITDRRQASRPLAEVVEAALEAGFAAVMVREKDLGGRELLELAEPLWHACRRWGRPLLVNDRLDVALALAGAGAHVGRAGVPVARARALLGPDRALGYSAHGVDEARGALAEGADYVTLSPIFPSRSKPDYAPRGVDFLAEAAVSLPAGRVVALGGLSEGTLPEARAAGAGGAAVMGDLMRARAPRERADALVSAWSSPGGRE